VLHAPDSLNASCDDYDVGGSCIAPPDVTAVYRRAEKYLGIKS